MASAPIVDRAFADKFLISVDRPLEYGVYFLFHDWWEGAPAAAIDGYMEELHAIPARPHSCASAISPSR